MNIRWRLVNAQYGNAERAYVGRWCVGSVFYDATRPRQDITKYAAVIKLPGLEVNQGHFETEEEAKHKIEESVKYWFSLTQQDPT